MSFIVFGERVSLDIVRLYMAVSAAMLSSLGIYSSTESGNCCVWRRAQWVPQWGPSGSSRFLFLSMATQDLPVLYVTLSWRSLSDGRSTWFITSTVNLWTWQDKFPSPHHCSKTPNLGERLIAVLPKLRDHAQSQPNDRIGSAADAWTASVPKEQQCAPRTIFLSGPVGKLPPCKRVQCLRCRFGIVKLHEDLAHACGLPTSANRARDFEIEYHAILGALIADVVADF